MTIGLLIDKTSCYGRVSGQIELDSTRRTGAVVFNKDDAKERLKLSNASSVTTTDFGYSIGFKLETAVEYLSPKV